MSTSRSIAEAEADVNLKAMWYKTDPEYATVRCTEALLNSVHMRARNGCTALMLAVLQGCSESVNILVQSGADVNIRSLEGFTPLMLATNMGQKHCVEILLKAEADVNSHVNGLTALHFPVQHVTTSHQCIALSGVVM